MAEDNEETFLDASITPATPSKHEISQFYQQKFDEQREEMMKTAQLYAKILNENKALTIKLAESQQKEMDNVAKLKSMEEQLAKRLKEQDERIKLLERSSQQAVSQSPPVLSIPIPARNNQVNFFKPPSNALSSTLKPSLLKNDTPSFTFNLNESEDVSERNHSSNYSINYYNNFTTTERLIHEQSLTYDLMEIRKNLPKVEPFDSNPNNWISFQRVMNHKQQQESLKRNHQQIPKETRRKTIQIKQILILAKYYIIPINCTLVVSFGPPELCH